MILKKKRTTSSTTAEHVSFGLGWWNIYFIAKLGLFSQDIIDFHPLENIALAIFILIPIAKPFVRRTRGVIAVILGLWLAHYDSYLPPLQRLFAQIGQLLDFKLDYLLELMGRFVSPQAFIALFVLIAAYVFLDKIFRVSVFVMLAMLYVAIPQSAPTPAPTQVVQASPQANPGNVADNASTPAAPVEVNDTVLNQHLADFFATQKDKIAPFPDAAPTAPFDVLFLSICSIAWDDLEVTGLADHPLFKRFDVMFDNFSAATSYSGPAVVRLLRAGCGQESHSDLFKPAHSEQCYLFDNLAKLGFDQNFIMNHNGQFDNFIGLLEDDGHLKAKLMPHDGLKPYQTVFDGSQIYRDSDVLNKWLADREQNPAKQVVTLFNTISLHDGNRIIGASDQTGLTGYKMRVKNLLDDMNTFFDALEASKRNIVVVLVPEHGAGMRGDKMQIPGMRELPAKTIVHTPVALKIFGGDVKSTGEQVKVTQDSSYLALSTLIGRILDQDIYAKKTFDPKALTQNLPKTEMVAQNSGSTVMEFQGKSYISLDGQTWNEYPSQ
ncbi:MAG: cellulose biosynthesis protein BcsG [Vibrio sp.]